MNVRLYFDDFELSGYENIKVGSVEELSQLDKFDLGELDELILDHVADYFPINKVEEILNRLSKFVKRGGKFIVQGTDLYEICKSYTNYNIDMVEANKVIYGNNPDRVKRVSFTAVGISSFLEQVVQLKIVKKRISNFTYMIEAIRWVNKEK